MKIFFKITNKINFLLIIYLFDILLLLQTKKILFNNNQKPLQNSFLQTHSIFPFFNFDFFSNNNQIDPSTPINTVPKTNQPDFCGKYKKNNNKRNLADTIKAFKTGHNFSNNVKSVSTSHSNTGTSYAVAESKGPGSVAIAKSNNSNSYAIAKSDGTGKANASTYGGGSSTAAAMGNGSAVSRVINNGKATALSEGNGKSEADSRGGISEATSKGNGDAFAVSQDESVSKATAIGNAKAIALSTDKGTALSTANSNSHSNANASDNSLSEASSESKAKSLAIATDNSTANATANANSIAMSTANNNSVAQSNALSDAEAIAKSSGNGYSSVLANANSQAVADSKDNSVVIVESNCKSKAEGISNDRLKPVGGNLNSFVMLKKIDLFDRFDVSDININALNKTKEEYPLANISSNDKQILTNLNTLYLENANNLKKDTVVSTLPPAVDNNASILKDCLKPSDKNTTAILKDDLKPAVNNTIITNSILKDVVKPLENNTTVAKDGLLTVLPTDNKSSILKDIIAGLIPTQKNSAIVDENKVLIPVQSDKQITPKEIELNYFAGPIFNNIEESEERKIIGKNYLKNSSNKRLIDNTSNFENNERVELNKNENVNKNNLIDQNISIENKSDKNINNVNMNGKIEDVNNPVINYTKKFDNRNYKPVLNSHLNSTETKDSEVLSLNINENKDNINEVKPVTINIQKENKENISDMKNESAKNNNLQAEKEKLPYEKENLNNLKKFLPKNNEIEKDIGNDSFYSKFQPKINDDFYPTKSKTNFRKNIKDNKISETQENINPGKSVKKINSIWTNTKFKANEISCSNKGKIVAIGKDKELYQYNLVSNEFSLFKQNEKKNNLVNLNLGYDSMPLVVTKKGNLYFLDSKNVWIRLHGCASQISIGEHGEIFKLGCTEDTRGFSIYQLNCYKKEANSEVLQTNENKNYDENNAAKSEKNNSENYAENSDKNNDETYPENSEKNDNEIDPEKYEENIDKINNSEIILKNLDYLLKNNFDNLTCKWIKFEGNAKKLIVGNDGLPFIISKKDSFIYKSDGKYWDAISGIKAQDFDISNENILFIAGTDGKIYQLDIEKDYVSSIFDEIEADKITVGPLSRPTILTTKDNLVLTSIKI